MSYEIKENVSLQPFNTFGVKMLAKHFVEISNETDLQAVLQEKSAEKMLILGGGSNVLFTQDFAGLVIKLNLTGITVTEETRTDVLVTVAAGENWHQFVLWSLEHDWGGVENLSLIPGNVGTAPIQNIGAYGVEAKDTIQGVEALARHTGEKRIFLKSDCQFGYRDSIFKNAEKGKWIITAVTFRLNKNPQVNVSYGALKAALVAQGITQPTIHDVSQTVVAVRQSKLPDPVKIGNGGSFFKNPVIPTATYQKIRGFFPEIPGYELPNDQTKVPAAWLIDQAGWKGVRNGDAGVHDKQALVLVNYSNATGAEIWTLAQEIQASVQNKFGIQLEPEINVL